MHFEPKPASSGDAFRSAVAAFGASATASPFRFSAEDTSEAEDEERVFRSMRMVQPPMPSRQASDTLTQLNDSSDSLLFSCACSDSTDSLPAFHMGSVPMAPTKASSRRSNSRSNSRSSSPTHAAAPPHRPPMVKRGKSVPSGLIAFSPRPSEPMPSIQGSRGSSTGDELDELVHEWARLRVETGELRKRNAAASEGLELLSSNNAQIRAALGTPAPPPFVAAVAPVQPPPAMMPSPERRGAVVVVEESFDDDDDELLAEGEEDDEEDVMVVTQPSATDAATQPEPEPEPLGAGGKRSRSIASELIAEPLHPAKQTLEPANRTSPALQHTRLDELRALIAAERAERSKLLAAFDHNETLLAQLRRDNAALMHELKELKEASEEAA